MRMSEDATPFEHALEQDFHLAACRLATDDSRRDHACVVEHEQIARAQQRWQIGETQVAHARGSALQMQQATPRSFARGPLCNQIFRQVVGEVGAPHWARTVDYTGSSGNGGAGSVTGPGPSTRMPGTPGIASIVPSIAGPNCRPRSKRAPSKRFSHPSSGTVTSNDMRFFVRRMLSFSFSPA